MAWHFRLSEIGVRTRPKTNPITLGTSCIRCV